MTQTPNLQDGPFLAFHDDAGLQRKMLASVKAHVKADQVVQGIYSPDEWASEEEFRGCFIGCTVHALKNGNTEKFDSNHGVFEAYGFPAPLTRICEAIFEGLPADKASWFFNAVPHALNKGADISLVQWEFLHWMVKDTLKKHGTAEVRKGCSKSVVVLKDMSNGVRVTSRRADAAWDAAQAAGAAARAAGDAARDARDAGDAARAVRAAGDTAWDARYKEFADMLLQLLGDAK